MNSLYLLFPLLLLSCYDSKNSIDSYKTIRDHKIHYKQDGTGKEIVLVHGGYLDLSMWDPQVILLKEGRTVLRFSDVGHGETVSGQTTIYGHEIIDSLSTATPEDPTTLVGLSWGAMLSVDFVLRHPDRVDKLILVSPGLSGWEYFQDTTAARINKLRKNATLQNDIDEAAQLFQQNWVIGPTRTASDIEPDLYHWSLQCIKDNMTKHWGQNWSSLDSVPAIDRLSSISVPTLIITGSEDAEDIKSIAKLYSQKMPHCTHVIVDGSAHLVSREDATTFDQHMLSFLEDD